MGGTSERHEQGQASAVLFPLPAPLALQRLASPSLLYRHPRIPYENSSHGVGSYMRSSWQSDKAIRQSVLEHEDLTRPPMLSKRFLASAHIQLHHCQPCGLSSDISGRYSAHRVLRRPPVSTLCSHDKVTLFRTVF